MAAKNSKAKSVKELAVGPEGSGKSAAQWHFAKQEPHLVTLDLHGDELFKSVDAYATTPREFLAAMTKYYYARRAGRPFKVTWHVGGDRRAALDLATETLIRSAGGALFIDESESFIPSTAKLTDNAFHLAKHSRHKGGIALYMTAHKPTELHNKFRTNLSIMRVFFTEYGGTIDYLAEKKRIHHEKKEVLNLLKSLGDYEFLLDVPREPLKKMKKIKIT